MKKTVTATVTHRFRASAERVFDAWLDPVTARAWMSVTNPSLGEPDVRRVEIDARVGGRFTFSDMRADGEAVHWGEYRLIDRPRKLVFTWWTSEEEEEADLSTVTLTIEPDDTGCVASIVHEMSAEWSEWIPQTRQGWGGMLDQIDTHLT
ncbi:MAG: SRPBCC domain-containing protein [Labilithrix sp.]|nr:SRPBCC domain-containing protein [Labilithrix sp.]